ncbi:hypothetical protein [Streptomyces luteireticuli]|uniref:hypothetical protein n=1 Tax=Streptomyces luteireticuli TaxID=173858 RepID=UPI003556C65D
MIRTRGPADAALSTRRQPTMTPPQRALARAFTPLARGARRLTPLLDRFFVLFLRVRLSLPRTRTALIPLLGILATLGALAPAAAADGPDDYAPGGVGELMPSPIKPDGQGTLFETYSPDVFQLDKQLSSDLTGGDLIDGWMNGIAEFLMRILTVIGRAAVVIVEWCFNFVSLPEIEKPIEHAIGAAAAPMVQMFLPAALAVGGFTAWARRSQTSPLGQLAWVAASAALATTLLVSPGTWVKGVDNGRKVGSDLAMTTIGAGLTGTDDAAMPFKTPEPQWSGNAKDDTMRRAADAVWRTYVVTPWCVADLGTIKACQKWGPSIVKLKDDMDGREDYLKTTLTDKTVGKAAVNWRQGHTPGGRIAVLAAAIVSATIFCALVIVMAFATLASLIGALMLLVCGVAFATLWCIPGKPRQWGVAWFEMLLGLVLVSFTSTMLLGSVMVVSCAMLTMLGTYGWLMVSALNICATVMAFKVKGRLDGIVSAGGAQLAGRGFLGTIGRMASARRLRKAFSGKSNRPGFGDMDRQPVAVTGGGSSGSDMSGAAAATRTHQSRNFPPPPNYPPRPNHPPAPNYPPPPVQPPHPTGGPGGHGAGTGLGTPGPARNPGAQQKAQAAGQKAGNGARGRRTAAAMHPGTGSGTAAGGYGVRYGSPPWTGIPDPTAPQTRVLRGTVVGSADHGTGRFRSYPPPPAGPERPAPRAPRTVTGTPVTPGASRPRPSAPALPPAPPGKDA